MTSQFVSRSAVSSRRSPGLETPTAVLNFLECIADPAVQDLLSEGIELRPFALGDPLWPIGELGSELSVELSSEFVADAGLWIVCQGRVRLLSPQTQNLRDISLEVLEPEGLFGYEGSLAAPYSASLCYRAVAASAGLVGVLPRSVLQSCLDLDHGTQSLAEILAQGADRRRRLWFFKTQVDWASGSASGSGAAIPSHQLSEWSAGLVARRIDRQTSLNQAGDGCFWLVAGQIESHDPLAPAPGLGDRWGHPQPIPEAWTAATDLELYHLPLEGWDRAIGLLPSLGAASPAPNAETHAETPKTDRPVAKKFRLGLAPMKAPIADLPAAEVAPDSGSEPGSGSGQIIQFPTPSRRGKRHIRWGLRYPYIEQQSSSDCGIACLAMISHYWGKRYPLYQLRDWARVGRSGTTIRNLAATAEKIGFQARPVRASLDRLAEQSYPWVAHWQGDHYIVVYKIRRQRVLVADPAAGKRWMTRSEFLVGWTGYALLLEPTDRLKQVEAVKAQSLGQFGRHLLTYWPLLGQIILLSLLLQIFGLVSPLFTQIILDQVIVNKSESALNIFAFGLLIFGIWQLGLGAVRQYLLDYFSNRMSLTMVSAFMSHTLRLPLKFFEDRNVGDILTRVQENSKIQQFLMRQAISTWLDASMAIVYIGLMVYYNAKLAMLVLALIPPMVILTLIATPFLKQLSREIFKESADQSSLLVEMISGIATVKSAAAEQEIRWRWEDRLVSLINVQFRGQKLGIGLQTVSGFINSIGSTALLWYGASLVMQDQLTIGQFVAFNMLIGRVLGPVLSLIGIWDEFQEVLIAVERLNDVFATVPEESPGNPMMALPSIRGEVRLDDVTFSYDGASDHSILQNLSFRVEAGQTIGIVGRSGSGKSTLIKLLQGLYHPTKGRILIDGHDIHHVSPQSLRSQLGVVPQECFLFTGTILDNIQLYRSEFSLEQAIEVAKLAEAHPFIQDLPLGYNTKVGERGANLSGGQRQRIAIARALAGKPGILILDEATSSLDTESERRFQRNLEQISRDRTTFIIAHRLSTIQHADCILVLDRGILVEQGTHSELMERQGIYYTLAHQQLSL
jgi:HlyB family type I secretion system ABC transporter